MSAAPNEPQTSLQNNFNTRADVAREKAKSLYQFNKIERERIFEAAVRQDAARRAEEAAFKDSEEYRKRVGHAVEQLRAEQKQSPERHLTPAGERRAPSEEMILKQAAAKVSSDHQAELQRIESVYQTTVDALKRQAAADGRGPKIETREVGEVSSALRAEFDRARRTKEDEGRSR
jgi:hypothetical protein